MRCELQFAAPQDQLKVETERKYQLDEDVQIFDYFKLYD